MKEKFKIIECEHEDGDVYYVKITVGDREYDDRFTLKGKELSLKKMGSKDTLNYKLCSEMVRAAKTKSLKKREAPDV